MIKLSELIGKPLLDLGKAAIFTVGNVYFDYKKNTAAILELICGDDDCEYKYLNFRNIYKIGEAVTVKDSSAFFPTNKTEYSPSPIGKAAFTQDGKSLGVVKDVLLENENIQSYITEKSEFTYPVISVSPNAVIFNDSGKAFNINKKKKLTKPDTRNVKIALSEPQPQTVKDVANAKSERQNVEIPSKPDYTTVIHSPNASPVTKYEFLLGKRADKDIFSDYGKLIVGIDELITNEIIVAAKNEGKLVQLAMHSR